MARIIKPGIRRVKELHGTCDHCTCVFAVEEGDLCHDTVLGEERKYYPCPCCNKRVYTFLATTTTVDYGPPKMTPPPQPWQHPHMEPPKPRL